MGGHNGLNRVKSCEKYDSNTNQWTKFEDMNVSRSDACAAVHDRCIFIAGGLNEQIIENTVEMYNPIDKTWTFIQPMSSPRTSLGFVNYKQFLYAIGGNNGFERFLLKVLFFIPNK
jgi:N-acetylneuraminic acid mutarotase